jgi:hypothetical protein
MSLIPEEKGKLIIEYSPDDTFRALNKALNSKHSNFRIQNLNAQSHSFSVKSCVNLKSWGEYLQITINPSQKGFSEIMISSKSKFGLIDLGKNQENINNITVLLTEELNNGEYQKVQLSESSDIPEFIKKLSDLKDSGILTVEEFESKKAELLSRM